MSRPQGGFGALSPALAWLPQLSPAMWVVVVALAAAAALLPGVWTLPGVVGIALLAIVLLVPEAALCLLTLSVPLGSLLEIELGSFSLTPTEGLVALMVIAWVARSLAKRRVEIPYTPLSIPLAAMLVVIVISGSHARELPMTIKEALKWLELALVYLFVVAEMGTPRRARILVLFLLAGAAIEGLLGFGQFLLGIGPDFFAVGRFMRAYGTFDQPNPFAGYLGMLIPLGFALLLTRPSGNLRRYLLVCSLIAVGAVGISLSRGAWVGLALGFSAMLLFWSRRSLILLAGGAIAASPLAGLAFLNLLPEELTSRLATALDYFRLVDVTQEVPTALNWAVLERMAHWQAALDMIAADPLFGVGAGNYSAAYPYFSLEGWTEPLGHAHNYYLNIAAETGIPGLLIYLALMSIALFQAARWLARTGKFSRLSTGVSSVRRQAPALEQRDGSHHIFWRALLLGVLGSLLAAAVHNMFDSLFVHGMSVQLGMILALGQLSVNALSGDVSGSSRVSGRQYDRMEPTT